MAPSPQKFQVCVCYCFHAVVPRLGFVRNKRQTRRNKMKIEIKIAQILPIPNSFGTTRYFKVILTLII